MVGSETMGRQEASKERVETPERIWFWMPRMEELVWRRREEDGASKRKGKRKMRKREEAEEEGEGEVRLDSS